MSSTHLEQLVNLLKTPSPELGDEKDTEQEARSCTATEHVSDLGSEVPIWRVREVGSAKSDEESGHDVKGSGDSDGLFAHLQTTDF